jgi:hypothetical protein
VFCDCTDKRLALATIGWLGAFALFACEYRIAGVTVIRNPYFNYFDDLIIDFTLSTRLCLANKSFQFAVIGEFSYIDRANKYSFSASFNPFIIWSVVYSIA